MDGLNIALVFLVLFGIPVGIYLLDLSRRREQERRQQHARQLLLNDARMKREALARYYANEHLSPVSRRFDSVDLSTSIAMHDAQELLTLVAGGSGGCLGFSYPPEAIVGAKVVEDGTSFEETRTDRSSQAKGILVGELLGGHAGAIIGGLSANKISTSTRLSTSIELHVMVESFDRPLWRIIFSNQTILYGSPDYLSRKQAAQQWEAALQVLMHKGMHAGAPAPNRVSPRRGPQPPPLPPRLPAEPSYHVAKGGADIGALPVSRIRAMVGRGELSLDEDFYFDGQTGGWSLLLECPALASMDAA